ncbi:MAG: DNA-directed RNA polymerase subunit omega [Syntrophomonadaceae bacterium]|jgi:DNA-directed RNA polymerase subunit omega|nr:DNA-directed RNA polymerase subunit omega [Syntrophomonadaceae bacterium]
MIPPSTRELIKIADSKYAVVVAVAKRARSLSEKKKDEDYRLSTMVTEALEDIINGKVKIN